MARRKKAEEGGGLPEWMSTYSDLVTLLLTFFILLFSMASLDTAKFTAVSQSMRNSFSIISMSDLFFSNQGDQMVSITDASNATQDNPESPERGSEEYVKSLESQVAELQGKLGEKEKELADAEAELTGYQEKESAGSQYELTEEEKIQHEIREIRQKKLNNFRKEINEELDKLGIGGYVAIVDEEEKLVLRLSSQILFESGSAVLNDEGHAVMLGLGASFQDLDHFIEVQGHTDNVPIHSYQFPSNWELSTQRATNVVRILQDECGVPPAHLRATGFGEYQPIGDNTTPEGRQANRRIDIVITAQ